MMEQTQGVLNFNTKHFHRSKYVELLKGGKAYFDLLKKLIDEAKFEIHFQVYILQYDETGKIIVDALINAAKRNVDVYLVIDEFGSSDISESVLNKIKLSGIHFKWFRPVFQFGNWEFGRRMHHKILSVDETICVVTGANVADRYNDIGIEPAWLDFAVLSEGITAKEIKRRCLQIWEKNYEISKRWKEFRLHKVPSSIKSENPMVKVSVNDWLRGRVDIYNGYSKAISNAKQSIILLGGYFLPGRKIRRLLRVASQRGVEIKVILTGVSDVPFSKSAEKYLYAWMLKYGIKIYEWQPSILHGKVAVIDNEWSTIGSYNINYLSTFESLELNLEIIDRTFSKQLNDLLLGIITDECKETTNETYAKHFPTGVRIINWFSYRIVRWSMRILNTFSQKPKHYM